MGIRRSRSILAACVVAIPVCLLAAGRSFGQTYYVSATEGNDNNTGLSASSPWQSITKVDDTTFAPGSTILFQDGNNWYGSLDASSSGTATAPITYGSYGTGANPTFWGSDPISASAFQPVASEPDTYFVPTTTTVNSFLVNHQFADSASLVTNSSSDATNISYVESTANSWYYDSDASTPGLYVNTGSAISASNVYTAATRQNVVNNNGQSYVTFQNLTVQESAAANGGYGFLAMYGTNVSFVNCTAIATGKHAFSDIDSTNFLGQGLQASYSMPDQGGGGASAFVSYADPTAETNGTATWINDTYTNANGPYVGFITHVTNSVTNPTPIANVLVQNLVTVGVSSALSVGGTGNETVNIVGGHSDGGSVAIYGNTVVNGMLLTGNVIDVSGSNNVIENSIISGAEPDWEAGGDGAIVDDGTGTIIRYNTIVLSPNSGGLGAAIGLLNPSSNTQIYGNIIQSPVSAIYVPNIQTQQSAVFSNNLFSISPGSTQSGLLVVDGDGNYTFLGDWTDGTNLYAIYGDPEFLDPADGNYALQPGSPAIGVFDPTTDQYVEYDYNGNTRPLLMEDLGAIEVPEPASLSLIGLAPLLLWRRRSRRGQIPAV